MTEKDNAVNKVLVTIMDHEYVIKGEEPPEYIQSLAQIVNQKMNIIARKNRNLSQQKVAVLTALNLADELKKSTQAYENLVSLIEEEKNL